MKQFATIVGIAAILSLVLFAGCDTKNNTNTEVPLTVLDNSECPDGTCALPVPPKDPDLTDPEIRFDTGECFTFVVDDEAVKALGSTRAEVMLAIFEARTNGKYHTIEELLNLTVKIQGKDAPIKSLVKIVK